MLATDSVELYFTAARSSLKSGVVATYATPAGSWLFRGKI